MKSKRTSNSKDLNDEVGEESDTDLPVALSFTQQAKQRELHQKQINKAIIESRLKRKAIRKAKHNKQKQTVRHSKDEEVDDEVQFSPPNEQQKLKEKDPLEEEFNLPGHFTASDHLHCEEADDDDITEDKSVYGNESDEGYDGSEEQDRRKPKSILFDDIDSSTVVDADDEQNSKNSDLTSWDHKTWKKINRLNGIHVRILDSANIERTARQTCNSFRQNHLFSSSYSGRYGDVKRIAPNTLRNLSRKKKALASGR
ncbi:unnamed protein product [Trichobilharzia szidati]|nr:unnamed protein product [Trichobilharzia szidati]